MTTKITEEAVAFFLESNPGFFKDRDALLQKLALPHESKGTISLVERQISIMQEKQRESSQQLDGFITSAKDNAEIFDKSRKLILDLIAANKREDFFSVLENSLKKDFRCKAYSLIIFGQRPRQINHFTSRVTAEAASEYIGALMRAKKPTLGVLRPGEQDFLFRHNSEKVKSAAILSVKAQKKQVALLAIGSEDIHYFSSEMDTIFLNFIAEVLAILLPRHLPR